MIAATVSVLFPLILGFFIVRALSPEGTSRSLQVSLSVAVGYGILSCIVFVWLAIGGRPGRGVAIVEAVMAIAVGFAAFRFPRKSPAGETHSSPVVLRSKLLTWVRGYLLLTFAVILGMTAVRYVLNLIMTPHGYYDAWVDWNMKAKFLSSDDWRQLFTGVYDHVPDYPLFLPCSIAGIWMAAGNQSMIAPAAVAGLFLLATVGSLYSLVSERRSVSQALLACMVLLATYFYVHLSYAEYADIPLSCLFAATAALLVYHDSRDRESPGLLVLTGLTAGLSAWMKNEGLVFLPAIAITYFGFTWLARGFKDARRRMLWLAAGALLPLLVVLYFKARFAGPNWMIVQQGAHPHARTQTTGDLLANLTKWYKYEIVMDSFRFHLLHLGSLPQSILVALGAYGALLGFKVDRRERPAIFSLLATLLVMMAAYFLSFVVSPFDQPPWDIPWLVRTTLDRLLMQVWPTAILVYFLSVRTLDQVLVRVRAARSDQPETIPAGAG